MKELLEILRVVLSLFFLTISSWYDYKTREVSNKVWVFFGPIGFVLSMLQSYVDFVSGKQVFLSMWLLSFGLTTVISLVIFYVGFFGGADAKALICLGLTLPVYPSFTRVSLSVFIPFFPLAVLSNAVLSSSLLVLAITCINLMQMVKDKEWLFKGYGTASIWVKILAFFTGLRVDPEKLMENSHYIPLEELSRGEDGGVVKRLRISTRLEDEDKKSGNHFSELLNEVDCKIWATPGLPFLIFITGGLVIALVLGDFVSWLVLQLVNSGVI